MPLKDELKINKQHAVPQNIMDVEFRIIGDLTMRQFFYLLVFGGVAYTVFTFFRESVFRWPLVLGSSAIGVFLAFVPVEDRGLDVWVVSFFRAIYSATQMLWRKEPELTPAFAYQSLSMVRQELITLAPTSSRRKLEEYLETGVQNKKTDPLDIPEAAFIEKVHNAFVQSAEAGTVVAVKEPEIEESQEFPFFEEPREEHKTPPPSPTPAVPIEKNTALVFPKQTETPLSPMTPDMHSGRRFTSFLSSEGTIDLPIRGERVLGAPGETIVEEDINQKAAQLKQLIEQIKTGEKSTLVQKQHGFSQQAVSREAQDMILKMKTENQKLAGEIDRLKALTRQQSPQEKSQTETALKALETKKAQAYADYRELQERVKQFEEKLETRPTAPIGPSAQKTLKIPMSDIPNTAAGVVLDHYGKTIPGAVIIIKDHKGEPKRALKTNPLGQFYTSVPLEDGHYTIEVANADAFNLKFNALAITAIGVTIPVIEFMPIM